MDPVILLVIALVVIGGPIAWLAGRWAWRWLIAGAVEARERLMTVARARTRRTVEDDSGDGGAVRCKAYDEWVKTGGRAEFMRASRSARANRPQDF